MQICISSLPGPTGWFGKVDWFIKCVSQESGRDSLYWVYFVLRGGGYLQWGQYYFIAGHSQWLTHNNIVPDCQLDAPRLLRGIWSQAATYLSSTVQLVQTYVMGEGEFICWEQQSFMWKYSALISSCSIHLWFNALHSPATDEIIFLNHGKYADLWIFTPNMVTLCILQCVQWIYTTPPSLTPSLGIICLATAHYITTCMEIVSSERKIFLHSCNFLFRLNKIDRLRESLMPRDHSTRVLCDYAINHCLICIL